MACIWNITKRGRVAFNSFNADVAKQLGSWQIYDAGPGHVANGPFNQGGGPFGTAHSRRMGVISSTLPSLWGRGPAQMQRMRRKGRTVKRSERSDGETDRERARRKWKMRGWQFKWRSGIKRKKKRGEDERKGRGDSLREEERETIGRIIRKWKWVFGGVGEEERQRDPEEEEGRRMGCIKNEGRRQRRVIGRWGMAKIKNKHFPKKEIKEEMLSKGLWE